MLGRRYNTNNNSHIDAKWFENNDTERSHDRSPKFNSNTEL